VGVDVELESAIFEVEVGRGLGSWGVAGRDWVAVGGGGCDWLGRALVA
jgi:hypothetical protein